MIEITVPAKNRVTIIGKLLKTEVVPGTSKEGRDYARATALVRATQSYGDRERITDENEIQVSFLAMKLKKDGGANPAYRGLLELANMATAEKEGFDDADRIKISGASIQENIFVPANSSTAITTPRIQATFFGKPAPEEEDCAIFNNDIYILNMDRETDRDGEETGRLTVRGAIVQWGAKVDVINYVVEDPKYVEYIERNWGVDDNVNVRGRIRFTTKVESLSSNEDSFGEDLPETTTRSKKEFIITSGSQFPKDEEFAYTTEDIREAMSSRKARIEQAEQDAKNADRKPASSAAKAATGKTGKGAPRGWE